MPNQDLCVFPNFW